MLRADAARVPKRSTTPQSPQTMARYYVIQPTQPLFPPSTHRHHPRRSRAIRPRAMCECSGG